MILGHLPAGYLCTKGLVRILPIRILTKANLKWLMLAGGLGSILPDLDMFYFYLIDDKQHLHHGYWTHLPVFWFTVFSLWGILAAATRNARLGLYCFLVSVNVFLHLLLDTVTGGIKWLYPFASEDVVFFLIPSVRSWWVGNFILHGTFLIEIVLILGACTLFTWTRIINRNERGKGWKV